MTELERARQVIDEALKKAGHVGPLRMRTAYERLVRADERAKVLTELADKGRLIQGSLG